jgi:hypothetical protein
MNLHAQWMENFESDCISLEDIPAKRGTTIQIANLERKYLM